MEKKELFKALTSHSDATIKWYDTPCHKMGDRRWSIVDRIGSIGTTHHTINVSGREVVVVHGRIGSLKHKRYLEGK